MLGMWTRMRASTFLSRSLHLIPTMCLSPSRWKASSFFCLSGVEDPGLTTLYHRTDSAGSVNCYLGLDSQLLVVSRTLHQPDEYCGFSANSFAYVGVQRETVCHCGVEVHAFTHHFQLTVAADLDNRSVPDTSAHSMFSSS